ncbi:hypothetical protein [Falsiroseomonas sp.]|uniref:hypothetical protein n=1 Tax=Falsiroseomonas sp. TaxID=2870721 RepID=UPI0027350281|nr:hypothetical protein [Falsiroseomonas sp.]MDP3414916.1 hypothetical protein [Falsiroseomonas sp.]
MMKSGKDVLWSLDLFGSTPSQRGPFTGGTFTGGPFTGGTLTSGPAIKGVSVAEVAAMLPPTAEQEGAYLRYGRPVLQILAAADGHAARLGQIRDVLAERDPQFDFDVLRTALGELERRQALRLAERDPRSGDHLYGLTQAGLALAG